MNKLSALVIPFPLSERDRMVLETFHELMQFRGTTEKVREHRAAIFEAYADQMASRGLEQEAVTFEVETFKNDVADLMCRSILFDCGIAPKTGGAA